MAGELLYEHDYGPMGDFGFDILYLKTPEVGSPWTPRGCDADAAVVLGTLLLSHLRGIEKKLRGLGWYPWWTRGPKLDWYHPGF